jgi:hypothetical protein
MDTFQLTDLLLDDVDTIVASACPFLKEAQDLADANPDIAGIWFDFQNPAIVLDCACARPYQMKVAELPAHQREFDGTRPEGTYVGLVLTRRFGKYASASDDIKGLLGWNDRYYSPSPAAAAIATGLLGAGIGYGGASILSKFLPSSWGWDTGNLRRAGLIGGGVIGALPGITEMGKSGLIGQSVWDGNHMTEESRLRRFIDKTNRQEQQQKAPPFIPVKTGGYETAPAGSSIPYQYGTPTINSEQLLKTVWTHPGASQYLKPSERAVFTGAVTGAGHVSGSAYPTPSDFARLTAGMGLGYAGGYAAGRVLGTLTGLPVPAQNTLANTGMYFGAVKATLPLLFGAGIR